MVRAVPLAGLLVVTASAALFGLCNVIVKGVGDLSYSSFLDGLLDAGRECRPLHNCLLQIYWDRFACFLDPHL